MALVYFSLGSNQGNRLKSLVTATKLIESLVGKVQLFSAVVETEPWGFRAEIAFYNQALIVETDLSPQQVLSVIIDIEKTMGRIRTGEAYISRIIDIDILFYDEDIVHETNLIIPHPLMHLRKFVLAPLADIAPDIVHPDSGKTISELLLNAEDASRIQVVVEKNEFASLLEMKN